MEGLVREFNECVFWAGMCFVSGVLLREWSPDAIGKWIGRASVLVAIVLLSIFGNHSVRQCQYLQQVKFQEVNNGHQIAHMAPKKSHTVTTPKGRTISWTDEADESGVRFMLGAAGSIRRGFSGFRQFGRRDERSGSASHGDVYGFDDLPNDESVKSF